ncbi:GNAT family N-acetyltransferase [Streptomyces sp. NPDC013457]|uniref:GNAT family N-acetyltransferase n=1 Tax=Streptomyces sp. NPDC013457 TaxID=3364866 RepID=UPI003702D262
MPDVSVRRAAPADRPTVERLWLMFRHDLSEYSGVLPRPDGTFRSERLDSAFADADWAAYLVTSGEHPVGLAFVRGLSAPTRVLNSFFVVRAARRAGVGLRAVREVMAAHPGRWEVAFQDENAGAVRFWRRVAADIVGEAWEEERRPVPGRPDVPPDAWISLDVPATPRPGPDGPGLDGPGLDGPGLDGPGLDWPGSVT